MEDNLKHLVLCHGLNNKPSVMHDLMNYFESMGFVVHLVQLKGHGHKTEVIQANDWIKDIYQTHQDIPANAKKFFCGFSIGCLSHQIATQHHQLHWDYSWYFSPAIKIKWFVHILRILKPFPKLRLPSSSPKYARAHNWLPVAYYIELLRMHQLINYQQLVKGRIFISYKDEVISSKRLLKAAKTMKHSSIKESRKDGSSYHLTILFDSLGLDDVDFVKEQIKKDLEALLLRT